VVKLLKKKAREWQVFIGIPDGSICGAIAIKELIEYIGRQRDVETTFLLVVYVIQSERARYWYLDEAAFHICINRAAACVFTITKFFPLLGYTQMSIWLQ
jgi:hypothetical protein